MHQQTLDNLFSPVQLQVAQGLLSQYDDEPQYSEGLNQELCLSWQDKTVKILYEISRTGRVSLWRVDPKNQTYDGDGL